MVLIITPAENKTNAPIIPALNIALALESLCWLEPASIYIIPVAIITMAARMLPATSRKPPKSSQRVRSSSIVIGRPVGTGID